MASDRILAVSRKGIVPVLRALRKRSASLIRESACRKSTSLPVDLLNPALSWLALPRGACTMMGLNGRHRFEGVIGGSAISNDNFKTDRFWAFRSVSRQAGNPVR
jgi:hypothetical protein